MGVQPQRRSLTRDGAVPSLGSLQGFPSPPSRDEAQTPPCVEPQGPCQRPRDGLGAEDPEVLTGARLQLEDWPPRIIQRSVTQTPFGHGPCFAPRVQRRI